jgi:hypothetical protein
MKRILILAVSFIALVNCSFGQTATPRFGITPNQDNTGRILTYRFIHATDTTGADTVNLVPSSWETLVLLNPIVDGLSFNVSTVSNTYAGDWLTFQMVNGSTAGNIVKFIGTNFQFGSGGSSITFKASGRAYISFRFDGTYWVETMRMVQ